MTTKCVVAAVVAAKKFEGYFKRQSGAKMISQSLKYLKALGEVLLLFQIPQYPAVFIVYESLMSSGTRLAVVELIQTLRFCPLPFSKGKGS